MNPEVDAIIGSLNDDEKDVLIYTRSQRTYSVSTPGGKAKAQRLVAKGLLKENTRHNWPSPYSDRFFLTRLGRKVAGELRKLTKDPIHMGWVP
jgi:hypothetical protein